MNILGLYPMPYDYQVRHDFSASLITNSGIYSYEESKLTTLKNENTSIFAERSMLMGFKELGLSPNDIDIIALPNYAVEPNDRILKALYWDTFKFNSTFDKNFEDWKKQKFFYVPHHAAHIEVAVFCSGLDEVAFLSMDGGGDWGDPRNFVFGEYKNRSQKILVESSGLKTIASFHAFLTEAIGFTGGDNGKTSGLSGYGKVIQELSESLETLIQLDLYSLNFNRVRYSRSQNQISRLDPSKYDRTKFLNSSPSNTNLLDLVMEYQVQDIAATGEYVVQKFVIKLLKNLKKLTSCNKLVLSGGLFQNVALNSAILDSEIFKDVLVPMAPSDAGLSLGLAVYAQNNHSPKKALGKLASRNELNPFLGPSFSKEEVLKELKNHRIIFQELNNIEISTARLLANGYVVGWFQGRAEYGPRSLGARSILADPRNSNSKSRVNQLLKKRDWFMPYAPSILEEYSKEWLLREKFSPYMQFALKIKREKRNSIPSAVHIDGSSRVHTVRKKWNIRYWNLIDEFRKITGVPLILNTSFNRHGISTISTPKQAIEHLLSGCMDYLVIENYLVSLTENRSLETESDSSLITEEQLLLDMNYERLEVVKKFGNNVQIEKFLSKFD